MPKFLITKQSYNRVTGPIMVTTSPRTTCPDACPLRKTSSDPRSAGCYAEHGFLGGFIWTKLDRLEPGATFKSGQIKVYDLPELVRIIQDLPEGAIWRHNQAGDLYTANRSDIHETTLFQIVNANQGRRGFTYTHFDVLDHLENRRLVREANRAGFTINLSANDIAHAERLTALNIAPIASVIPPDRRRSFKTNRGLRVVVCPAQVHADMTCATCGICAKQRNAIVGLPAIGAGAGRATARNPSREDMRIPADNRRIVSRH